MAAAAIMLLLGVGVYTSDPMAEFRAHSNHNPEYAFAYVKECESGLRDSGYALAPSGTDRPETGQPGRQRRRRLHRLTPECGDDGQTGGQPPDPPAPTMLLTRSRSAFRRMKPCASAWS